MMSDEPPPHAPAEAVSAPTSAQTAIGLLLGPRQASPSTVLDRAARAIRVATDGAALGLSLYDTFRPELRWHGIVGFWIVSLPLFPYPRVAEQLRQKRQLPVLLLLAGVALGMFGGLQPGIGKEAFLGLMLVMVAWSVRLFVQAPPSEPASLARVFVGVGALASGALYVWLGVHAA